MRTLDAIRLALAQLRVQKLKSAFTLLGVTIGVMFLIAVVSIVEGMGKYVEEDFASRLIGTNTFTVRRFDNVAGGPGGNRGFDSREAQRRPLLRMTDIDAVRGALPASMTSTISSETFKYASAPGARPRQVQAVATDANYFAIKKFAVDQGRAFTDQEVRAGAPVLVIGVEVAEHFFPGLNPINRVLRVSGVPFTVIGVVEKQGSVFGFSLDRLAIAPYTSPMQRIIRPLRDFSTLIVQAPTQAELAEGIELARGALRAFRGLRAAEPDNFGIVTQDAAFGFIKQLKGRLVLFGTALPAISLVVGAMVIMNIMLVAVSERTREIGVRKALGAKRKDILSQFLVEAATLSTIGAAIGIGLGIGLAELVAALTPLPAAVAPWSIVAALVTGAGVGIGAGLYPASRASQLDPIAALRAD
ncbi:ABC transporter permease [Gemmatimonas sp.]|uniref:ABC transporter permease n=1 Tax=Gemmatimonas sp. TaxID=1962908 RepID=UPI0022C6D2A6|nr:ABC transporter permease [Gemmatimonas sp.]MCA2983441.1 ABC transporter permease [Gemmatimonas sp.]MCA2986546.1 ABC transporter permease [Gemmatimonas sp.]MCA2992016.1 ABC transporter permease [Gemmatimonas sp.]MCA2994431.1 ABC transporter permease [Gemmatimonas sp.]MCE2952300.1 ABC transporter permease [Gemmatimonas sp.]